VSWYLELSSLDLATPVLVDSSSNGHLAFNVEQLDRCNTDPGIIFFMLMSFMESIAAKE
jgi:hypothetical protein